MAINPDMQKTLQLVQEASLRIKTIERAQAVLAAEKEAAEGYLQAILSSGGKDVPPPPTMGEDAQSAVGQAALNAELVDEIVAVAIRRIIGGELIATGPLVRIQNNTESGRFQSDEENVSAAPAADPSTFHCSACGFAHAIACPICSQTKFDPEFDGGCGFTDHVASHG